MSTSQQSQQINIQPHILNRFNVLKKIGSGAYGHVWKVQDKGTKKIYALKKIFDAFQHSTDAQRTYREIQVLRQLDHPNIIKLHQTIKAENNKDVYLVFQFMQADLHNVISQGILKQVHIKFIVYQLAKALKYLHSGLAIHRDLKPSNILINSNCIIKLCDFGLVRSIIPHDENAAVLTEGVATRWYRAPQVLLGSTKYSTPADIWSFGCIIYEIVAQKPMFPGDNTTDQLAKILSYSGYPSEQQLKSLKSDSARALLKQSKISHYIQPSKNLLKDFPPQLAELIRRMTIFAPNQRITIDQLLNHEAVQAFKKKEEQIACDKIICLEVSDNKKLSVDQYRNLVYGLKRGKSADLDIKTKKATLLNHESSKNFETLQRQRQKQRQKHTLKYVRSKQYLKPNYNKSMQFSTQQSYKSFNNVSNGVGSYLNSSISNYASLKEKEKQKERQKQRQKQKQKEKQRQREKQEKTAQTRSRYAIDPTRVTYISKNFYSPKYGDLGNVPSTSSINSNSIGSSMHVNRTSIGFGYNTSSSNNISYTTPNPSAGQGGYQSTKAVTSPTGSSYYNSKVGQSYTSSSAYTNQRKPMLFKSSKYVITGKERQAESDHYAKNDQ